MGFGLETSPGRHRRNEDGFTPRSQKRLQVSDTSADLVGPPPPSSLFLVVPGYQRMEFGAVGHTGGRSDCGFDWPDHDGNGSPESRHLVATLTVRASANLKKTLKPQESLLFLQVPRAATAL